MPSVLTDIRNDLLYVTLNRPEQKNAFNISMIRESEDVFRTIPVNVRAVVIAGAGTSFCAGADLEWMQSQVRNSYEQNLAETRHLQNMLTSVFNCRQPVIAQMHGHVMGGGVGLACTCDILVSSDDTKFCLSEVKLGLVPAVISPYVINKLGLNKATSLGISARPFTATQALNWNMIDAVTPLAHLATAVQQWTEDLLQCAPLAQRATKRLFRELPHWAPETVLQNTAELISRRRISAEGQRGLKGFLQKNPVRWQSETVTDESD